MILEYTFFLAIILITVLANKLTGFLNLRFPTIPGFYFIWFLLMATTLLQPLEIELHSSSKGYNNFLIALLEHAFFFLLGLVLSYNRKWVKSKVIADRIYENNFVFNESKIIKIVSYFSLALFLHALISIQKIPILEILRAGADESMAADATVNKEALFKGDIGLNNYIWNLNRQILFPIVIIYYFSLYFLNRNKGNFRMFMFFFIIGVINNSISGSLAPVALIFFMLGLTFVYLSIGIKAKHYLIVFFCSLSFPIFVEYSATDKDFFDSAEVTVTKTIYRFSGETFKRSIDYFNVYGVDEEFLGGRTHKIFTYFSGDEYFNVSNHIFVKNLPERKLFYASTGHQNAHFICYLYSDFGHIGVIIGSFIMGFILAKFQLLCTNRVRDKISFSAYIILVTLFWKLMGVHPFTILFSHGGILLIVFVDFLYKRYKRYGYVSFKV